MAFEEADVATLCRVVGHLLGEGKVRLRASCDDQHAGCSLVEPVDDPRACRFPEAESRELRHLWPARDDAGDQRSGGVPGPRVDHLVERLVDDDEVLVDEEHVDLDLWLGNDRQIGRYRQDRLEALLRDQRH